MNRLPVPTSLGTDGASKPPEPASSCTRSRAAPHRRSDPSPEGSLGSSPLTPPLSPSHSSPSASPTSPDAGPDFNRTSPGRTLRTRQEYLDSLQPPSEDEFERLAKLQEQRKAEHRHRDQLLRQRLLAESRKNMGKLGDPDPDQDAVRAKAATVIQRRYRGYRSRREMQGLSLDASTRWTHAIRDAQWNELTRPRARSMGFLSRDEGSSDDEDRPSTSRSNARQNWLKVARIARRAGGDMDSDRSGSSSSLPDAETLERMNTEQREAARRKRAKAKDKRRRHAKMMGYQYFLEMVDLKHRYGSNLRTYHEEWKKADTNQNFFYWLDYGEGKNVEVPSCPRERLEREQVRYLSREERQYYLVNVDPQGRLVWAKNGMRIDTTEEWKDSIHGIVPKDDPTPAFAPEVEKHIQAKPTADAAPEPHSHLSSELDASSLSSRESELEAATAAKYADPTFEKGKGVKKLQKVSAATIFNKLLRKSVRKNTWIFVADTSFRLYVGIKASGAFQHSSFLQGSRISAAGLIKVKDGRLSSLSPLSGHYRPPASNFRAFVHALEAAGVDMSHVSISKSYAVLVGLEGYIKTQAKGKQALRAVKHQKNRLVAPELAREHEQATLDSSRSAARERDVEMEEERRRAENKASVKLLQKLRVRPRTPAGQVHGDGAGEEADDEAAAEQAAIDEIER